MKRKSHDDIAVLVDAAKAVVSQEDLTDYAPPFTLKEVEAEKSSHANDKTALVLMLNHLLFMMARLSAAERPAPTCATCKHLKTRREVNDEYYSHCDRAKLDLTDVPDGFGCWFHEPGQVAQEKDK